jgi:hypothetical protein
MPVFKFVEHPENNEKPLDQKCKVKFKIVSLKVKGPMEYVPELFDEQKDQVAVEQILRVVFLDAERPSPVSLSKALFSFCFFFFPLMQCNFSRTSGLAYTFWQHFLSKWTS